MNNSALWIILHRMRAPLLVLIVTYSIAIIGFLVLDGVDNNGNTYRMTIFDAFYVVSYTATTIGFGEIPYAFSYPQRIWMSMIIYATVMGWFYSLGTLIALLKDQLLIAQIAEAKFVKQVKNMNQHFLLVLGYNHITSEIIKKANKEGVRTIVIEKDENKLNELLLENYTPIVPFLMADVYDPLALQKAGLHSKYCKAVVSLFADDDLNLRVALTAKFLNKNVKLAIKTTTHSQSEDLKDLGVDVVENPYEIIAEQIDMSLRNPYMLILEKWIYGAGKLNDKIIQLPKERYVVYGFGKLGRKIYEVLTNNGIEVVFIKPLIEDISIIPNDMLHLVKCQGSDEKELLIEADIMNASAIIARTTSDTLNLSILASARKVNPNIVTIARENEMTDFSVFRNAKIDMVFIPSKVLIDRTTNALIAPYSNKFLELIREKNDPDFVQSVVMRIINKIGPNPITFGLTINEEKSYAIWNSIVHKKRVVTLDVVARSRSDWEKRNKILPLILIRDGEPYLLPSWDIELQLEDKILFASDEEAKEDLRWISKNIYEFFYVYFGKEKNMFNKLFKGKY
ncbi:MAG: NAD-binding protein [Arcobacteraceae bacterium]|nr:NAD-binding protein [Arcobacteraceae bacterium]